jgi:hypothetical protein
MSSEALFKKWHKETHQKLVETNFFKNREQEGKTGPVWELVPV